MAVPNWYSDPMRRFQYRYFDGTQWTSDVSTNGVVASDPLSAPSQVTASTEKAFASPTAGESGPPHSTGRLPLWAWAAIAVGVIAVVAVVFAVAGSGKSSNRVDEPAFIARMHQIAQTPGGMTLGFRFQSDSDILSGGYVWCGRLSAGETVDGISQRGEIMPDIGDAMASGVEAAHQYLCPNA